MGQIYQMLKHEDIVAVAAEVGFDLCGVARCTRFERNELAYERWLEAGYDSSLEYMRRNIDKRFDVTALVEGAQTVVVCAVGYKNGINESYDSSTRCKIASYACNRDYHKSLKKMLQQMMARLRQLYPDLQGRAFVDSAPLLEKQYAVEAGLGWIGRQSLLITEQYGSYVLLGELVLNIESDHYDNPFEGIGCGECHRCREACPTGALVDDRVVNTSRCISCRTIEQLQQGEANLRGWIFGCDECQMCCPYNKRAKSYNNSLFKPLFNPNSISADEWLSMSEDEFLARFSTTPLKRSGLERIKSNI